MDIDIVATYPKFSLKKRFVPSNKDTGSKTEITKVLISSKVRIKHKGKYYFVLVSKNYELVEFQFEPTLIKYINEFLEECSKTYHLYNFPDKITREVLIEGGNLKKDTRNLSDKELILLNMHPIYNMH